MGEHHGWRHCPRCAAALEHEEGVVSCRSCGFRHYASSTPAVSAFLLDADGRVLLARRGVEPDRGLWDTPGGFLDEGEPPADGLRRELREETGLEIELAGFVDAYVDTYGEGEAAPGVLNLVFEARANGEPIADDDVTELRWFDRENLPADDELAFRWLAPALRAWAARPLESPEGPSPALRLGEGEGEASNESLLQRDS